MTNLTSQQVIRNYLVIAGLYTLSASLIWGVNTLFLLGAGLNIAEVFIANAAYTAGMVIFEIPTGVLADTRGRRDSFLLSVIIVLLATIGYVWVGETDGGVVMFSLMSVLLGLGFTFYSGAVEAWLVDALDATGYEGALDHVFARGSMVTGAAMLVGSVGGGIIGTSDLALPYVIRVILLAGVFVFAFFSMYDVGYERRALNLGAIPKEMSRVARESVQYGWRESHIRLLMLASFIQFGFMSWAFYAWQPYFLELYGDPNAVWIAGVVAAALSFATIAGNLFVEWITHHDGKRTTLMIGAVTVFSLGMAGVGLTNSFWVAVGLFLLASSTMGVLGPVRQSYIHHIVPSEQRATVISVDSMFGSAGGIVSQVGLGRLSQQVGIAEGYVLGGFASLLCIPLMFALRRLQGEADIIVGDAGHRGGHASQGLPDVCQVENKPSHDIAAD